MELNPPEGGADWVEIYNPDNGERGHQRMDGRDHRRKLGRKSSLPCPGTILPAKGFLCLQRSSSWNHNDGGYATLFSASGDIVDKTANRQDTMNNDFTYGRHPDGYDTNTDGDWGLGSATR